MPEQKGVSVIKGDENKKHWFDRIYLCCEYNVNKPNTYSPISGFHCWKFDTFYNADYAWNNIITRNADYTWNNKITGNFTHEVRHRMIPICKWVPEIFDSYILNWQLKKMYWGGKITISNGYKRHP